jgi:hypothetical protein
MLPLLLVRRVRARERKKIVKLHRNLAPIFELIFFQQLFLVDCGRISMHSLMMLFNQLELKLFYLNPEPDFVFF